MGRLDGPGTQPCPDERRLSRFGIWGDDPSRESPVAVGQALRLRGRAIPRHGDDEPRCTPVL
jgi:hypothetical protein